VYEEFGDTKRPIKIRKSKKDRKHNGQEQKDTQLSTKKTTQKTKDRATRTSLKTEGELICSGRVYMH